MSPAGVATGPQRDALPIGPHYVVQHPVLEDGERIARRRRDRQVTELAHEILMLLPLDADRGVLHLRQELLLVREVRARIGHQLVGDGIHLGSANPRAHCRVQAVDDLEKPLVLGIHRRDPEVELRLPDEELVGSHVGAPLRERDHKMLHE